MSDSWYWPNSAGSEEAMHAIASQCAGAFPTALLRLQGCANNKPYIQPLMWSDGIMSQTGRQMSERLGKAFNKYRSDKANNHNYHELYGEILVSFGDRPAILEIGLGSNDESIASNMGAEGTPGASIRAWRETFPRASIVGADIDQSIKVEGEEVHYVDQTKYESFNSIIDRHARFDLMIDDGLHVPHANVNTLTAFLKMMGQNSVIVIEDIPDQALDIWSLVAFQLSANYETTLIRMRSAFVFIVVQKGSSLIRRIKFKTGL